MNMLVLKRIVKYLKKDIITFILSLILSIIVVGCTIYIPILFGDAIDTIIGPTLVDFEKLKYITVLVVIILGITGVTQWIQMLLNNKMAYRITRRLRREAFIKIQNLPLKYIDSHPSGEIVSIVINDVDQFSEGLLLGFNQAFTGIATIIGTIIFMIKINWFLAIIVIFVTPLSLFVAKFIASSTYKMFKKQAEAKGRQTGFIDEMISNLKVIKAYNYEEHNLIKFKEINDELAVCSFKATFFSSLTNPCTRFVNSIVYALVALIGALFVINPFISGLVLSVGELTCYLSYANQYTKPFNEISSVITELQNSFACISRVFSLLDEEEIVKDSNNAYYFDEVKGNIKLEHLYFSYNKNQKLIEDLTLNVHEGAKIAIVGPTGCGKTTLINLLMRFYEINNGNIYIDNHEIRDIAITNLRENYGMVLQDTWIKSATVKENIMLGNHDATDEDVIIACKKAHCHSFIKKLPKGYDTIIEDNESLSVGQKQLLCIARIMLNQPSILILDEATSSIDTRTELKIQDAFNNIMDGKTTFIVAHRLSTIKEADIILVMNNGNVIEQGTHQELLNKKGFYYNLYNAQFEQ